MPDYTPYIGIPYKLNGRKLDELDCYGLVMLLYKDFHNIDLPDVEVPQTAYGMSVEIEREKAKWVPCELEEGAVIIFNIAGYGSHVGYYIGNDRMIHTWQGTGGVLIERIGFAWKHRIMGVYKWQQKS